MTIANDARIDVAVVGGGSAGAAAALHCARAGLRVTLCEARRLEEAGARWVNAVPTWTFARAGIAPPRGAELLGEGGVVHLVAGRRRIVVHDCPLLEVDMRRLTRRLHREARAAGAELREEARVERWDGRRLQTSQGRLAPRWVVDASGVPGARLLAQPLPAPADTCSAAQQVHAVTDADAARRYFARWDARLGDAISFVGQTGGFSTLGLRCDADGRRVGLLTGTIPAEGHAGGPALLGRFVAEQRWIGARLFGGSRAIPLGRPHDRLADDRVALLGDAAGQVFSAHGSGVAHGLVAARLLARALASGHGPWGYAVDYQRGLGGTLAAFDEIRRLTQAMTVVEQEQLVAAGALSADTVRFALAQGARPLPSPTALARAVTGALLRPRLGARLALALGRMAALLALYRGYPADPRRLPAWSRRVAAAGRSR